MIERIDADGALIALIIRSEYKKDGISFFTEDAMSQQLAYMSHPAGKAIAPHVHNPVPREVQYTQEVLFIKSGAVRADFFDRSRDYIESRVLRAGDVILLASGGHGFEVLEDCEMIEVKQGPYAGEGDKTRFTPTPALTVRVPE